MKKQTFHKILFILLMLLSFQWAEAQRDPLRGIGSRMGGMGRSGSGTQDSLQRRDHSEDSITLRYTILDSARTYMLDTSILDFTARYPIPATHVYLGTTGAATRSHLFETRGRAGFDPGFHAYDVYKFRMEDVRFYNTTRPFTEIGYALASKAEQNIDVFHTQNMKPYWNASIRYRLINAPGFIRNQKTFHNNYQLTSWYQSPNKRYNNYFVFLRNKLQAQESGGIRNDISYLDSAEYDDRYIIPTKIGSSDNSNRDFFNFERPTGNFYDEKNIVLRQQYDLGRKDSLVTDSTVIPLFYPRLRFEHTFKQGTYEYDFQDIVGDSSFYIKNYGLPRVARTDSIHARDKWREITNDFSIYQFPDAKNLQQFIKAGIEYQFLKGNIRGGSQNFYNLMLHGEYRNRTRNLKWDLSAFGKLYINGYNAGDYHAYASLQRSIGKQLGSLQLGFENINRTAPFIFDNRSQFYFDVTKTFNKENTTHLFARINNSALRLQLGADYYLVGNYLYVANYSQLRQEAALFNVLRVHALKTFRVGRNWRLHSEVYVQQKTGNVQLNIPALFTRNRFAYEGNFGFPNLNFAGGVEVRYHTPYKMDNYSPVLGQFFYQDSTTINNMPDVHAFVHFRIKRFKAFFRLENLNAAQFSPDGFGFTNNNLAAPDYPIPGLLFRFSIFWAFVN